MFRSLRGRHWMTFNTLCQCGGRRSQAGVCSRKDCTFNNRTRKRQKKTTAQRGYGNDHRKHSERFRKENPYCARCLAEGVVALADHLDHIEPFLRQDGSIDESLRMDPANHQSLCSHCHDGPKKRIEQEAKRQGKSVKTLWAEELERIKERASIG